MGHLSPPQSTKESDPSLELPSPQHGNRRLLPHLNWTEVPSTTKGEPSSSYKQARGPSIRSPLRKSSQKKGLPSLPGLRFLSSSRDSRWLAVMTREISPQVSRLESPFFLRDLRPPSCSQVARTWKVISTPTGRGIQPKQESSIRSSVLSLKPDSVLPSQRYQAVQPRRTLSAPLESIRKLVGDPETSEKPSRLK